MVMEAPPSPQSVGREFVRQYYTLLNKAPTHLHRFYNHQSSFVHGGLDPPNRETSPVIGQKQIHQKIQQLNFRDCHAKITQVDSQATLGNGVVVQVTGELSNGGQPMRRFTQTFVLAAQSPKKYYVHNDIFRYQDEIVSEDEECDGDVRSDPEEEVQGGQVMMEAPLPINQPVVPPYYPNAGPIPANLPAVPIHHNQQPPPHVLNAPPQPLPAVNGAMHPEDIPIMQGPVPPHVPAPQLPGLGAPLPAMQAGLVPAPMPPVLVEESQQPPQLVMEEPAEEQLEVDYSAEEAELEAEEEVNNIETSPSSNSNEPKTYANLLKSGNAAPFASAQPAQAVLSPAAAQPAGSASPPQTASGGFQQVGGRSSTGRVAPRGGQQSRAGGRQEPRVGGSTRNEDSAYDERRRGQGAGFGDANQLFLGNLPHAASEDELREIFGEFGVIVDLRVHSKPANKVGGAPAGRAPPNFGFITFESQQGVQNCLQASPIFYPKDDKNGTLLNVEGKKTKPSYGGGRPSADNRGGAPRRGGAAASGPTRGGPPRPGGAYSNRGFNRR